MIRNRILTTCVLAALVLSLTGCVYNLHYRVSTAITSTGKTINYSRINYPEVSLHIRLFNDICTQRDSLFPLKQENPDLGFYRHRPSYETNKEFRILIGVLPKGPGYSLDAKQITLLVDNVEVRVAGIEGPVDYFPYTSFAFPKDWDETQLKKEAADGYVFSFPSKATEGYAFAVPSKGGVRRNADSDDLLLDLPEVDLWNCFELIFHCPTPAPERDIKLKLDGLRRMGRPINIRPVEFRESLYKDRGENI
jgi:hypothetical protein